MKHTFLSLQLTGLLSAGVALSGCHDVVVKVQKKPKDANLSSVQATAGLNLTGTQDFLKQLDSLKGVAADVIVRQLAQSNYRSKVRTSIRKYREFLISRATTPLNLKDSFYTGTDDCRKASLSFDMHDADQFLGVILQTVVLAKIGEASAGNLGGDLAQQIAAISQLILLDMGLDVKGTVNVDKGADLTTTTGSITVALKPIQDEKIDDQTKAADQDQTISMTFTRGLADHDVGTFKATIDVTRKNTAGTLDTLEGAFAVNRSESNGHFDNALKFSLGVKGGLVNYARNLDFQQVKGTSTKIQVIDTFNPGAEGQVSYPSIIDLKALTQCKGTAPEGTAGGPQGATDSSNDHSEPMPDEGSMGAGSGAGTGGTGANGTGSNGTGSNGTGSNGTGSNGTGSNGTGSNGTGSNGTGSNGTGSNGTGSSGTGSSGTGSNGTGSNGTGTGSSGTGSGSSTDTKDNGGKTDTSGGKTSTNSGGKTSTDADKPTTTTNHPAQTPSQTKTPSQTVI